MKKPTFYEQVGIIIPGAVFLFGLLFYFPSLRDLLAKDGITVGQLGIYVLLSYAALGNVGETLLWRLASGMPTDWVTKSNTTLISAQQRDLVEKKLRSRLGIEVDGIQGLNRKVWFPISRQLYSDVAQHGKPDRIETFNGNYGLNRGLASACFVLACVAATQQSWWPCTLLAALTIVYGYRAYRFAVHYGRELYMQFLTIGDIPARPLAKED